MASFGAGIDRESVFVEKFEALFTKHLAGAGNLMICLLACFNALINAYFKLRYGTTTLAINAHHH